MLLLLLLLVLLLLLLPLPSCHERLLSLSAALEGARLIPPCQEAEEAGEAGDERDRAEEERRKKLELALHLDDRFDTAEANGSYIKLVRHLADEGVSSLRLKKSAGRGPGRLNVLASISSLKRAGFYSLKPKGQPVSYPCLDQAAISRVMKDRVMKDSFAKNFRGLFG